MKYSLRGYIYITTLYNISRWKSIDFADILSPKFVEFKPFIGHGANADPGKIIGQWLHFRPGIRDSAHIPLVSQ